MTQVLKFLAKSIAALGGVATFALINTLPTKYNVMVKNSDYYKKAIELLHNNPEAIKYLGEPIKEYSINVTNKENYGNNGEIGWFKVKVEGSQSKGELFCDYILKIDNEQLPQLLRVELTVDSLKGYKLLIKQPDKVL